MKIKNGYRTLREGKGKKIREKGNGKWERAAQGPVAAVDSGQRTVNSGQKRVALRARKKSNGYRKTYGRAYPFYLFSKYD